MALKDDALSASTSTIQDDIMHTLHTIGDEITQKSRMTTKTTVQVSQTKLTT